MIVTAPSALPLLPALQEAPRTDVVTVVVRPAHRNPERDRDYLKMAVPAIVAGAHDLRSSLIQHYLSNTRRSLETYTSSTRHWSA